MTLPFLICSLYFQDVRIVVWIRFVNGTHWVSDAWFGAGLIEKGEWL
jgi:hypothetical protein